MAKKVEEKKTVKKKATSKKSVPVKEIKEVKEIEEDEVLDFEEYDDEEEVVTKKMYKEHKSVLPKRKKKEDVLGDSLLKQNAEIVNFFKILIGLLIFLGIFYLIIAFARGEIGSKKTNKQEDEVRTIQNEEILASSVFTKEDKEYYVLLFDSESKKASFYETMYSDYTENYPSIPMFYVDLNNKFNKEVVSEKTNKKAQKFSELKVSSPTLIHIKNGKNIDYYEGEEVTKQMTKLNK